MAGDWIKVENVMPHKPEVIAIAASLDLDTDAVVGKLIRLWIWADQQTITGNARGVTKAFLDRYTCAPGFADALQSAGWLRLKDGEMTFPNFDRHNGQTAKQRALTSKRVAASRAKSSNARGVTQALPEKRREEKSKKKNTTYSSCSEPSKMAAEPPAAGDHDEASKQQPSEPKPLLTFPCVGTPPTWDLTCTLAAKLKDAYPALDRKAEYMKALAWLEANPARRKTARGMARFLNGWLERAQNSGRGAITGRLTPESAVPDAPRKLFVGTPPAEGAPT